MATNLMLDDDLIAQAMEAGHNLTKRETVNEVLRSYGAFLQQQRILDLFGQVDFDPEHNYKAERNRPCGRLPRTATVAGLSRPGLWPMARDRARSTCLAEA